LKNIYKHIVFWILWMTLFYIFAFSRSTKENPADLTTFIFVYLILIGVFYYNIHILSKFGEKKLLLTAAIIVGYISYVILRYFISYYFLPYIGRPIYDKFVPKLFIGNQTFLFLTYTIYALVYWYAQKSIKAQRQMRIYETEKLQLQNDNLLLQNENLNLQNEKIKLEYNFLKAQINPHFLYNTLNFFYAKTLMHSEEAADGIAKLTDIMRYALQTGGADGKVSLEQEVEHLQNYIALQQMRFSNKVNINFTVTGNTHSYRILPHILITLLENAFKHGDTLDEQNPISVNLQAINNGIHFSIHNKIRVGPKDGPSTGVGLSNIADRLKMEYGDTQFLKYNKDDIFFSVQLNIQLSEVKNASLTKAI